ncbi:hypothetical protein NC652_037240 [Populus alba x Populus x berolinensis]|nr:hypothetical protein NC652_037240 [Populus alba x Populus x berolinensis]
MHARRCKVAYKEKHSKEIFFGGGGLKRKKKRESHARQEELDRKPEERTGAEPIGKTQKTVEQHCGIRRK